MKFSPFFLSLAFAALVMTACGDSSTSTAEADTSESTEEMTGPSGSYAVDVANSTVNWKGVMLGIKEHFGTVQLTEGTLQVENGVVTGGNFTVDLSTITPGDENYNEEQTPSMLVGHLSSPDFFDVENHPTATFSITGGEGNTAMGNLTVRGMTNAETVEGITLEESEGSVKASGTLTFDRKKYDVAWDSPVKEAVLSDDIQLEVQLSASKG